MTDSTSPLPHDDAATQLSVGQKLLFTAILCMFAAVFGLGVAELALWAVRSPTDVPVRIAHQPGERHTVKHVAYQYDVAINEMGLREDDLPLEPPAGQKRVVVVGDSFVEGVGVQAEDRFTEVLEAMLSTPQAPVEMVNAGLKGTGPLHHGRIFSKLGLKYQPQALLICIYANDIDDTSATATVADIDAVINPRTGLLWLLQSVLPRVKTRISMWLMQRRFANRTADGDLLGAVERIAKQRGIAQERVDAWKTKLKPELLKAADEGRFNPTILSVGLLKPEFWEVNIALKGRGKAQMAALERLHAATIKRARDAGVEVAMVYFPSCVTTTPLCHSDEAIAENLGVRTDRSWLRGQAPTVTSLHAFAKAQQVAFLDLTPTFRGAAAAGQPPVDYFPHDMHWNPRGNRIAAAAIARFLARPDVLPALSLPAPTTPTAQSSSD